jgi:phasin family protein
MLTVEQITSAQKNNLNVFFGFTETAFSGVEKLVELNLAAAKAAFSENVHHVQSMISIKDPAEIVALQSSFYQPIAEKSAAYSRHVYEIATSTSSELSKSIESNTQETQQAFMSMMDGATKNAPQGTEAAVAMFKNAMTASQNAIDTAQKAIKQVTETAEANIQAAVSSATSATKATKKRTAA